MLQHETHQLLTATIRRPPGIPPSECDGMLKVEGSFTDGEPIHHKCGECHMASKPDPIFKVQLYSCRECKHILVVEQPTNHRDTWRLRNDRST